MITVWTMCTGDQYPLKYVDRLWRMVKRNLTLPHRFICITEHQIEGWTHRPFCDYPGWWGKVSLFKPGVAAGPSLWLDLDVVITGSLDDLVTRYSGCELAMPWNWAKSGHGGCQSSVMVWKGNSAQQIWDEFDPAWAHWPPINRSGVLWGDQEWITHLRDKGRLNVTQIDPPLVQSYKYHCQNGVPDDCRVVVFHGEPKPSDVGDAWVKATWC